MAFIITDNDSGNIFDIQDSRKSIDLEKYFRRYSKKERDKVKHISTDFYSGYIFLANKLFKNAEISIDRFHIVIQAYNALNTTRVRLCYKSNPNYNKFKYYWKLIVKNENELSNEKKYSKYFKKEVSQKEIVQYLINTDKTLKASYDDKIKEAIKNAYESDSYKDVVKSVKGSSTKKTTEKESSPIVPIIVVGAIAVVLISGIVILAKKL